ncbi:DUF839 domain-containing protein [Phragmitibacter flavus]|uniref:DUF839 domain-containing protein n=1 Tax=Phragmitibacter flavus TaxID=2576071 RepID=A0A5R8KF40_9BACT|nr:alkaline phosphatase PhoX [Phragmitibacter flavus]TLD70913.1 DUF839 domain-containing protein [Phragmitibacter flavus]
MNHPPARVLSRRQFAQYLGAGAVIAASNRVLPNWLTAQTVTPAAQATPFLDGLNFPAVPNNMNDGVTLPEGFVSEVLVKYGDVINDRGETFGEDADYLAFVLDDESRGWLWVNHENSWWLKGEDLLRGVGGSCLRLRRDESTGRWRPVVKAEENFRVNGLDTKIQLLGPAAGSDVMGGVTEVLGSVGNCGGAVSPWGTFFSGEENYYEFTGDPDTPAGAEAPVHELPENLRRPARHYGWMVEIDPQTREVFKHTGLGRFAHENVAFGQTADGRLVAYQGDDKAGMHLYKYLSRGKYDAGAGKAANRALLTDGTLHVANLEQRRWIPLDPELTPALKEQGMTLADICVRTRAASIIAGGSALMRPEDVEIHPQTGEVYCALTSWENAQGKVGAILALREAGGDHGALTFEHEILHEGGQADGLTWQDNLAFGPANELLVTTDYKVDKDKPQPGTPWEQFGNNGLFVVPTSGPDRGKAKRFMSGPLGAELCSPTLSPDRMELWVNVQHPGEGGIGHWPGGGDSQPVSGLVVVKRESGEKGI